MTTSKLEQLGKAKDDAEQILKQAELAFQEASANYASATLSESGFEVGGIYFVTDDYNEERWIPVMLEGLDVDNEGTVEYTVTDLVAIFGEHKNEAIESTTGSFPFTVSRIYTFEEVVKLTRETLAKE